VSKGPVLDVYDDDDDDDDGIPNRLNYCQVFIQ
jgi:hypothetical protein